MVYVDVPVEKKFEKVVKIYWKKIKAAARNLMQQRRLVE